MLFFSRFSLFFSRFFLRRFRHSGLQCGYTFFQVGKFTIFLCQLLTAVGQLLFSFGQHLFQFHLLLGLLSQLGLEVLLFCFGLLTGRLGLSQLGLEFRALLFQSGFLVF